MNIQFLSYVSNITKIIEFLDRIMNLKFRKSIDSDLSLIVNYPEKENEFRITL